MFLRDVWFSYQSILSEELSKKNYFIFLRKIFGSLYKSLVKIIRHKFSINSTNLDKIESKNLSTLELDKLFIHFNCDKGSHCFFDKEKIVSHNYSAFYDKYFKIIKKNKISLLELGSHEGKGLASFFFYFPNSDLIGANINPFQMRFNSKRISELFVDVSSSRSISSLSGYLKKNPDIIIDDASHNLKDILTAFGILFKKLKSGGCYVIEDMDQFKALKELNPYSDEPTPLEILKKINDKQDFKTSFIDEESKKYLIENIKYIKIEKGSMKINEINVSDIAFVFKK
tara:strand:+ start:243 stop:1100 length:858 start_codon:yes stop_codon:yes gene_type:complete